MSTHPSAYIEPTRPFAGLYVLLAACCMLASCRDYEHDTVTFTVVGKTPPAKGPAPNIHIDTNIEVSGMAGGTIKSLKPYSIGIDYTDETFTFEAAEFTKVTVTYADGTNDPGAAALKLPARFKAREHEAVNSTAGGRIVKTRMRVISGNIPGAITRDMPITLRLEGTLIKDDGTTIPFTIKQEYEVETDKSTKPCAEVMNDR